MFATSHVTEVLIQNLRERDDHTRHFVLFRSCLGDSSRALRRENASLVEVGLDRCAESCDRRGWGAGTKPHVFGPCALGVQVLNGIPLSPKLFLVADPAGSVTSCGEM